MDDLLVMSNFRELTIKSVYRTGKDDLYKDFYKPVLSRSFSYDRAVGYFSSNLLSASLKGLSCLIRSNGKMRLIIGDPLDHEEFEAVKKGYKLKEFIETLTDKLLCILDETEQYQRLELLTTLIATGKLEIKFAMRRSGMYHEKIGIFRDTSSNIVVFQGSANETPSGMFSSLNAESISVYKSWDEQIFSEYGKEFIEGFERLWANEEYEVITLDVPSDIYEKIARKASGNLISLNFLEDYDLQEEQRSERVIKAIPSVPSMIGNKPFNIYKHQRDSLAAWKSNSFRGILKLATGSGKTITSIYGAVKIYEAKKIKNQKLFLLVAVPYIELALQWVDNLKLFGINAHQCFESKSSWASSFENHLNYFKAGVNDFCAAVVVNKTLSSEYFKSLINTVDKNSLMIIGDECHNHGSQNINLSLPDAFYRMGLSATPFRSDDDEIDSPFPNDAKQRLLSYYGEIVYSYDLSDAINDGVLTPYEYHIIPVYLTPEEQEGYEDLSSKIFNLIIRQRNSKLNIQERENLTRFCGQRSRLLGSAKNKLVKLQELTSNVSDEDKSHTLFYAGEGKPYSDPNEDDVKVIDQVSFVLNSNGWKTSKFTGDVSRNERKFLMSAFKDKTIDALVAMKVLDEGIDVPACKTAYILASTKNPRQYIQRRGRILRRSENKYISSIYDFVVLPINDSSASKNLKRSEAERINDFTLLAANKTDIEKLIEAHGLNYDIT